MLLAIDLGNTNIVFAIFDGEKIVGQWRSSTATMRTSDEYAVWLTKLMATENSKPGDIDAAIIASVVPEALFHLKSLCLDYFNSDPMVIGEEGIDPGLEIHVDRPEEVGADRLVNAVAAHRLFEGPLIIIDFGTATTFDLVDAKGAYCGGAIAPGINLSLEALHLGAAKLPRIAIRNPGSVIGKTTVGAMQSGIYWGYVALIEGMIARMTEEFGKPTTVVATGGLAPLFNDATDRIAHLVPDLTLQGLVWIHRLNV
jgi:type III pantothenate kinase